MAQRCGTIITDITKTFIIIVFEKSYPVHLRKWGIPKGHKESYDTNMLNCAKRETLEEVNLNLDKYNHNMLKTKKIGKLTVYYIQILDTIDNIKIKPGDEILKTFWVKINDVKDLIKKNPNQFNAAIRNAMKYI